MLNTQRVFVDAVRQYCARNNVSVDLGSQGWVIIMHRGAQRQLAFGYDLGLNSAVAHRIANDKAATSEVLQLADIPCIPHTLFLNPSLYEYVPPQRSWERMLRLIEDHPAGLVVKPNDGTSGKSVHKVMTESDLEVAAHRIFASNQSLAVSPYVEIQQEIRVVVLDDQPIVAYGKQRPSVVGDGKRSVLELVLAGTPRAKRAGILTSAFESSDNAELDSIPPPGQRRVVSWRHNLDSGAQPVLMEQGADRDACVEIARRAASAINIRFGSIDVVQVEGSWKILEINSGVMMEALSGSHPELVFAAYSAALDKVFGQTRV